MNFHNNAAFTKILHTINDHSNSTKESKEIYQSVLFKHFQIIQTFLQKINSLYNKQQEFETYLSNISQKIEKLESNTKNIHHQFRTTHLMIDKRLNTIGADFNVLQEKIQTGRKDTPIDQYLSSSKFLAQSSQLKSRRKIQNKNKCQNKIEYAKTSTDKVIISQTQLLDPTHEKQNQQTKHKQHKKKELGFKVDLVAKTCQKLSKIVESDYISSQSSICGGPSIMNKQLKNTQKRKKSQKHQESQNELKHESFESIEGVDDKIYRDGVQKEWVNQTIIKQSDRLKEEFEVQMCDLKLSFQKFKEQILKKMVKEEAIKQLQTAFEDRMAEEVEALKKITDDQQKSIHQLRYEMKNKVINYGQYQIKLNQKVDTSYFQESVNNLHSALADEFAKIERSYANKIQTKRALDFLENKINRIILEDIGVKNKKQVVNDDPCLRINRCESHKRIENLSEKSIKEKPDELSSHGFKSMNTSLWEIDPFENNSLAIKDENSKLRRVISNIISYKCPVISNIVVEDNKVAKSSSMPKTASNSRNDYESIKTEVPVKLKQWRDKVVKILKKDGCRKRKVTFR